MRDDMLKPDLTAGNQVARGSKSEAHRAENSKFPSGPLNMIRERIETGEAGGKKDFVLKGMMNRNRRYVMYQGA